MRSSLPLAACVLVSSLLVVLTGAASADPAATPESADAGSAKSTQSESSKVSGSDKSAAGQIEEKPDEAFVPTESISADSAISFPVDI